MIIWRKQFTFSWGKWQNLLQIFPVYAVYCNNAMTKIVGFFSQNFSFFSKIWENVLEMIIYFFKFADYKLIWDFSAILSVYTAPIQPLCDPMQTIIQIALGKIVWIFLFILPEFVIRAFFSNHPIWKKC